MKSVLTFLTINLLLHISSVADETFSATALIKDDLIEVVIKNRTKEFVLVSDPNCFGFTITTSSGGKTFNENPFEKKNTKLIALYPLEDDSEDSDSSFKFSFKGSGVKDIDVDRKRIVIWACRLSETNAKNILLKRFEIDLVDAAK